MKNAIITGGSSGIGLGIAKHFASKGYNLLINGLEKEGHLIALGIEKEFGTTCIFSAANLLYPDEIYQMIALAEEKLGPIQVLINNAGIQYVSPIEDFPDNKWEAIVGVNLSSVYYASKAVWKGMKSQGFGRIINITSAHGLRASEFKAAYVAAKHGVTGLTKVLALEGAPYGITCNAICPGYVRTPLVEGQIADQANAHHMTEEEVIEKVMLKKQAIKSFIPIEDLAALALFLASENSSTMTGVSLPMEGGWTSQ
ncbi:3-hydroxybutyrate dehydrogenase [Mongoliitalea daihaiensis]|uniref:3-hydroxybutyrate dehydrogenase n=1 Tax=Mongoliitalea daihaiensis TaxID=2782006 RepID=UPI001F1639DA|nr:3-hydroxybutyrate dehydrogenase [Mongoliitalea daihaiensis]UJP64559.1 3-hydroxybutyrate dehydrogenase [Mongoliitalea daihaiensis]